MTLTDFNKLLDDRYKKGLLFDVNGHLVNDILEEYLKNETNLKNEFFEGIEIDLDQNNTKNLSYHLGLLTVDPFRDDDHERFQRLVIKSIEKIENIYTPSKISELANFVWALLDHMLHNWTMSDEKLMIDKLKKLKVSLKKIESKYKDEVALLYQKLEHFGIE